MKKTKYTIAVALTLCSIGIAAETRSSARPTAEEQAKTIAKLESDAKARTALDGKRAGNPNDPELVSSTEIPSHENLTKLFKAAQQQLSPTILSNHKTGRADKVLSDFGCKREFDLPAGFEVSRDHLEGYLVLFSCADGRFGRLNHFVPAPPTAKSRSSFDPNAFNSKVASHPAVARFKKTSEGTLQNIWRWNTPAGSFILEVISPETSNVKSAVTPSSAYIASKSNALAIALSQSHDVSKQ